MGESSLKEQTAKGLFWGGLSNGIQQVVSLLIGIVLMKLLSLSDYGMVGLLAIFTGIASVIQESGFTAALTNRKTIVHKDYNAVFWFNLLVSLSLYLILFFCAPFIADFYNEPKLTNLSRVVFLSLLFGSLGIAHNAILFKKLMVKQRAIIDIVSLSLSGIAAVILALKGQGYWALVANQLIYIFCGTVLRWYFSKWKPTLDWDFSPIREMFGFSIKLLISNIFTQIQVNIFSVLLGRFYTKADVGIFSQGAKWANMGTTFIRGMINGVAQPVFAITNQEVERQAQIFRKTIRFIAFISFPFMMGIAFISQEFILMIDSKWLPSVPILQIYCFWGILASIQLLYSQFIISCGKSDLYFWNTILSGLLQIIAAVVSLPFGIYYLALSALITSLIYTLIWHWFVSRIIPIRLWDLLKDCMPYALVTIGSFGLTWIVTYKIEIVSLRMLLKILLTATCYILAMWYGRSVIFKESISFILKQRKK